MMGGAGWLSAVACGGAGASGSGQRTGTRATRRRMMGDSGTAEFPGVRSP